VNLYHKGLNQERWNGFSRDAQILMVGSEMIRAKNWIQRQNYQEVRECYFRAIELTEMMVDDPQWRGGLKEILRFKEQVGLAALFRNDDLDLCVGLTLALFSWNKETIKIPVGR